MQYECIHFCIILFCSCWNKLCRIFKCYLDAIQTSKVLVNCDELFKFPSLLLSQITKCAVSVFHIIEPDTCEVQTQMLQLHFDSNTSPISYTEMLRKKMWITHSDQPV